MLCLEKDANNKKDSQQEQLLTQNNLVFTPERLDVRNIKEIIGYITGLYRNGDIDSNTFDTISRQALTLYIEARITDKLDEIVHDKFNGFLGKVMTKTY
jgi:hypothetical protein